MAAAAEWRLVRWRLRDEWTSDRASRLRPVCRVTVRDQRTPATDPRVVCAAGSTTGLTVEGRWLFHGLARPTDDRPTSGALANNFLLRSTWHSVVVRMKRVPKQFGKTRNRCSFLLARRRYAFTGGSTPISSFVLGQGPPSNAMLKVSLDSAGAKSVKRLKQGARMWQTTDRQTTLCSYRRYSDSALKAYRSSSSSS